MSSRSPRTKSRTPTRSLVRPRSSVRSCMACLTRANLPPTSAPKRPPTLPEGHCRRIRRRSIQYSRWSLPDLFGKNWIIRSRARAKFRPRRPRQNQAAGSVQEVALRGRQSKKRSREEEEEDSPLLAPKKSKSGDSSAPGCSSPQRRRHKPRPQKTRPQRRRHKPRPQKTRPQRRRQKTRPQRRVRSFHLLYSVGELLGEGGYGSVYAGMRRVDGKQVAIKFIGKKPEEAEYDYLTIPGTSRQLPREVVLMQMAGNCEYVVELFDWFDQAEGFVLVMERPEACIDVWSYIEQQPWGRLHECQAKTIMEQTVLAARHCQDRGVFHHDIKSPNLLISTDSMRIKLIDFGCGDYLKETPYDEFFGTFKPPEAIHGPYQGLQAVVWSLGVSMFHMVTGQLPFFDDDDILAGDLFFTPGLSKSCKDLICWCLAPDPLNRPDLDQILLHDWFSEVSCPYM